MSLPSFFLTLDGPNGAGKSTLLRAIISFMEDAGHSVLQTREPTDSAVGRMCRTHESQIRGRALACLVAADRYHHVEAVILPALKSGRSVICDRYVESSLVLQCLDGVEREFVWELNSRVPRPDLSIILIADALILEARVNERATKSRFEREFRRTEELELYLSAADFLREQGYNVQVVDNSSDKSLAMNAIMQHVTALFTEAR